MWRRVSETKKCERNEKQFIHISNLHHVVSNNRITPANQKCWWFIYTRRTTNAERRTRRAKRTKMSKWTNEQKKSIGKVYRISSLLRTRSTLVVWCARHSVHRSHRVLISCPISLFASSDIQFGARTLSKTENWSAKHSHFHICRVHMMTTTTSSKRKHYIGSNRKPSRA